MQLKEPCLRSAKLLPTRANHGSPRYQKTENKCVHNNAHVPYDL